MYFILSALTRHYKMNEVTPRIHGNNKRLPANTNPLQSVVEGRDFLNNYVDECGILPLAASQDTAALMSSFFHPVRANHLFIDGNRKNT